MKPSIHRNLLNWLGAPLLTLNLIGAALTFWLAWAPTQTAWDHSLADTAWAILPRLKEAGGGVAVDLPRQAEQVLRVDHSDLIFFVVRDAGGLVLAGDKDFPVLPATPGLNEPHFEDGVMRAEPVRIVSLASKVGAQTVTISVGETLRRRDRSFWNIILTLSVLELLFALVSTVVVRLAVRKGIAPLQTMQHELDARAPLDLSPVADRDAPVELAPLLSAVNRLLARTQRGATAQQTFLADVAHQLRTPLAGARIHLEWLRARHAADTETTHITGMILSATERMIRQTNQLLALARAEPSHFSTTRFESFSLDGLVGDSVQQFVRLADEKGIDIGFDLRPARMTGDRFLVRDLVDNLVDNAIRYSPPAGTITVSCHEDDGHAVVGVEDNGPGIAENQREAVFDRFYRASTDLTGTGLGLAIVRDIATNHGASISIESGPNGAGTCFRVAFPSVQPS